MSRIFHIATAADWADAQSSGRYTTSTRGRTLAEEGFLHASRGDQWEGVRQRFYGDVAEPLVLLVIETDLLGVPVIEETVPDSTETFPHIYGALNPAAVVQALPLDSAAALPVATDPPASSPVAAPLEPGDPHESFSRIFFREMFFNLALATVVIAVVAAAVLIGREVDDDLGGLVGTGIGLAIGIPVAIALNRRRDAAEN